MYSEDDFTSKKAINLTLVVNFMREHPYTLLNFMKKASELEYEAIKKAFDNMDKYIELKKKIKGGEVTTEDLDPDDIYDPETITEIIANGSMLSTLFIVLLSVIGDDNRDFGDCVEECIDVLNTQILLTEGDDVKARRAGIN